MAKPVQIGDLHFNTKTEARNFFKSMLNKYEVGDKVGSVDEGVLRNAVDQHPKATEVIGSGIDSFSVRTADFQTQCFWVNRSDGTTEKFSIYKCY